MPEPLLELFIEAFEASASWFSAREILPRGSCNGGEARVAGERTGEMISSSSSIITFSSSTGLLKEWNLLLIDSKEDSGADSERRWEVSNLREEAEGVLKGPKAASRSMTGSESLNVEEIAADD